MCRDAPEIRLRRPSPFVKLRRMKNSGIIGHFGGYRQTLAFGYTCLVYHATTLFCRRNFDYKADPLGKTSGQMVGAARSARQNIVEASARAGTSREQELRQLDVAKGSLDELAGDYEAFIIDSNSVPWSVDDPRAIELSELKIDKFDEKDNVLHLYGLYLQSMRKRFGKWMESENPEIAANSILLVIRKASAMLYKMMCHDIDEIVDKGGFSERISKARITSRNEAAAEPGSPRCPKCGGPMRKKVARRGVNAGKPFWSCMAYPRCEGTVTI